jgi:hypothetical protein
MKLSELHKLLATVHVHGLSVEQMLVLNAILRLEIAKVPASADAIGEKTKMQPRAVRGFVKSLAADAWVNVSKGGQVDVSTITNRAKQLFTELDRNLK